MESLVLNAPPRIGLRRGPRRPTLIVPPGSTLRPFDDIAALARYVHRERAGRGMQIVRITAAVQGSDSFTAFSIRWQDDFGGEAYAFTAAGVGEQREAFEAALAEHNPDVPAASAASHHRRRRRA